MVHAPQKVARQLLDEGSFCCLGGVFIVARVSPSDLFSVPHSAVSRRAYDAWLKRQPTRRQQPNGIEGTLGHREQSGLPRFRFLGWGGLNDLSRALQARESCRASISFFAARSRVRVGRGSDARAALAVGLCFSP